jgi:hypothetical protein
MANAPTVEACRSELEEVLGEWSVLKIRDRDSLPVVDGLEIHGEEAIVKCDSQAGINRDDWEKD